MTHSLGGKSPVSRAGPTGRTGLWLEELAAIGKTQVSKDGGKGREGKKPMDYDDQACIHVKLSLHPDAMQIFVPQKKQRQLKSLILDDSNFHSSNSTAQQSPFYSFHSSITHYMKPLVQFLKNVQHSFDS